MQDYGYEMQRVALKHILLFFDIASSIHQRARVFAGHSLHYLLDINHISL
jgi:hypothetical protein